MAADRYIACRVCGAPYLTNRPNTKLCRVCQLRRDLEFVWGHKGIKCLLCDETFLPITRGEDPFCPDCTATRSRLNIDGECRFCGREGVLLHEDARVCRHCAHSPEYRERFMRALLKKQRERRAESDANPPDIDAMNAELWADREERPLVNV